MKYQGGYWEYTENYKWSLPSGVPRQLGEMSLEIESCFTATGHKSEGIKVFGQWGRYEVQEGLSTQEIDHHHHHHLLRAYCVPGTVLSTYHLLTL